MRTMAERPLQRDFPLALAICSAVAIAAGVGWRLADQRKDELAVASADEAPLETADEASVATTTPKSGNAPSISSATPAAPSLAGAEALAAYERALSLQNDVSEFLKGADRLAADERKRRAGDLTARIDDFESRRMIVGEQGLFLRAAIARAEFANDPAARDAAVAALHARYAAVKPSTTHLDARYRKLKAREAEIVAKAEGMKFFPNGQTREQYLRAELDAALAEAYAEPQ